jgi:hypothetical protein
MRQRVLLAALALIAVISVPALADDAGRVRKAIERSTLDQPGTNPFHLKAVLAPTRERDRDSGRTGEVEIWWESPTRFRQELRSPGFHRIEIVDGEHHWQKNEGDLYPEWLRQTAVALVRPIPDLDRVLQDVKGADVKRLMGSTYFQWQIMSTDGKVQKGMGASVALNDSSGLLFYAGGFGWGAEYKDYQKFHSRMVGRTVAVGSPEVTAKVSVLEDLRDTPPGFFDAQSAGPSVNPVDIVLMDEPSTRKNLIAGPPVQWPAIKDGPFEGSLTTTVLIDRTGKVRDVGPVIIDNLALRDEATRIVAGMQFQPFLLNGQPVEVLSRITMPFKSSRPEGAATFDTAKNYFERGRQLGFLAASAKVPYHLKADFEIATAPGKTEKGEYEDTWTSDGQWHREARMGDSRYVRTRNGDKRYQLAEGKEAPLLQFIVKVMEPIPALDTFYEGDWKIRQDTVNGVKTVRVLTGYETPEGKFDNNVRAYWFDESGQLIRTHFAGIDTLRSDFQDYSGIKIARRIDGFRNGARGLRIAVTQASAPSSLSPGMFEVPGHKWERAFTDEVR